MRPKRSFFASCFLACSLPASAIRTRLGDSGPRFGSNSGLDPDSASGSYAGCDTYIGSNPVGFSASISDPCSKSISGIDSNSVSHSHAHSHSDSR